MVGAVVGILEVVLLALVAISLLSTLLSHSADGGQAEGLGMEIPHEKWVFWDRREAGRLLAERLSGYRDGSRLSWPCRVGRASGVRGCPGARGAAQVRQLRHRTGPAYRHPH